MPTAGGAATVLASGQMSPGAIAADAGAVYWITNRLAIATRPRAGGGVSVLVAPTMVVEDAGGENDINALLADGTSLYYSRYTAAFKLPVGAVKPTLLGRSPAADLGQPFAFALDGDHLYQTEYFHKAVTRETLDGKQEGLLEDRMTMAPWAPDRIAVSQGSLLEEAIARWGDSVVWANGPTILRKAVTESEKAPALAVTSTMSGGDVTGFVVSGDVVYFGEANGNTIQKASLPMGAPVVVAEDQLNPRRFVADADGIYWRTDDCAIRTHPIR
jgi:hypothetical protein